MGIGKIGVCVDPKILAQCFAIFARIHIGATRYKRDDSDTYSPMMARLREDKCQDTRIIDGFLAIQRYLGLRGLGHVLFQYAPRILMLARATGQYPADMLPFTADPRESLASAVFFKALAGEFHWDQENPKSLQTLLAEVTGAAHDLLLTEDVTRLDFNPEPDRQVEAVTDLGRLANEAPTPGKRLH